VSPKFFINKNSGLILKFARDSITTMQDNTYSLIRLIAMVVSWRVSQHFNFANVMMRENDEVSWDVKRIGVSSP
jgi:hypothetical protein